MLGMIQSGELQPQKLLGATLDLNEAPAALVNMDRFEGRGVTVIDRF